MSLNLPSDLGTTQPFIPIVKDGNQSKLVGVPQIYATVAALAAAVEEERTIITGGKTRWLPGTHLIVSGEPGPRIWNATDKHARTIMVAGSFFVDLVGDLNTLTVVTQAPTGGIDGNKAIDLGNNLIYTKAAGTWNSGTKAIEYSNVSNVYPKVKADGTDQGPLINAAIASLGTQGGTVHLPVGQFNIGTPIDIPNTVTLKGASMPQGSGGNIGTRLQAMNAGQPIVKIVGAAINTRRFSVKCEDLGFRGGAFTMTVPLVQVDNASYIRFDRCHFGTTGNRGIWMRGAWDCRFFDCAWDFVGDAAGLYPACDLDSPTNGVYEYTNQIFFSQCRMESLPGVGLSLSGANTNEIFISDMKIESGAGNSILPLIRGVNATNLSMNNLQLTGQRVSGKEIASLMQINNCSIVHGFVSMENAGSGGTIATYLKIINSRAVSLDLGIVGGQAVPTSGKLVDWDDNNESSIHINYMGGMATPVGAPTRFGGSTGTQTSSTVFRPNGTTSVETALASIEADIAALDVPIGSFDVNPRRPASCFNRPTTTYGAYSRTWFTDKTIYIAPEGADYTDIEITWPGFATQGAEVALNADFLLEATIEIEGTIYPIVFDGAATTHQFVAGTTTAPKSGIGGGFNGKLTAGKPYWIRTLRTAASGSYYLTTCQVNQDDDSGQYSYNGSGTPPNYLYGGEPKGFRARPALVLQGDGTYSISSVNVISGGTGYPDGTTTLRAYDPDNGRNAVIQSRTATGGVIATGNSGSGMTNNTLWGINTTISAAAIGTSTEVYRPLLVSGIPSAPRNAWFWHMASTAVGYGGGDTYGNNIGAYGPLERALGRSVGIINCSVPAQNFQIWVNNTYWPTLNSVYDPVSGSIANFYAGDLTNDCGNVANTSTTLTTMIVNAYNYRKARGYTFTMATPTTRTTGPHVGAYRQPVAAGFGPGTAWEVITEAIRRPTRMNAMSPMLEIPCVDWARGMSDHRNQFAWRSDQMLFGPFSTLARLKLAYTASHYPGAVAVVGTPGAYALYDIVSGAWALRATAHLGVFANEFALETAFPAASNNGASALIGPADGPWVLWDSDGTAWYEHGIAMTGDGSHTNINLQRRSEEFNRPYIPDINGSVYYRDTRRMFNRPV